MCHNTYKCISVTVSKPDKNSFIDASINIHKENPRYGAASEYSNPKSMKFKLTIPRAIKAAQQICSIHSLLDHGTGQGGLIHTLSKDKDLELDLRGYDPAVDIFSKKPTSKYDVITSIDALEHIGRPFIYSTLKEISSLTNKFFFFCIDLLPASKKTSDGRNAHFLVAPSEWWIQQIKNEFRIISFIEVGTMGDGTDYPMHLFGCASNSMSNFKAMNTFLENVEVARNQWILKDGVFFLKPY